MDKYVIAPPSGSTNNSIGAADRHWEKGYFNELPNWQEYLAESTGYGIVSGCTPSITGLTVTVAAGVVHLADGTRKEISASTVTLDAADTTNPRIDLVYIDSTGVVAKVTGTASASPSVPSVPSGGISVAQVSVAANGTTGTVADTRGMLPRWYNAGVVNVKDFGAVGDGVTDDTAAIQAAITNAEDSTLLIPKGNYVINERIFSDNINNVINMGEYANIEPVFKNDDVIIGNIDSCSYVVGINDDFIPTTDSGNAMGMQGFTYDSKRQKVIVASVNQYVYQKLYKFTPTFDDNGIIKSLSLDNSVQHTDLYHCNSMAYCKDTDKVYVLLNGGGSTGKDIAVLNPDTLATENIITFSETAAHIAYDAKSKIFIRENYTDAVYTMYLYDLDFTLIKTVTIDASNINQGRNSLCCVGGEVIGATVSSFFEADIFGNLKSVIAFGQSFGQAIEPEDFEIINGHIYFNSPYIGHNTFWLYDKKYSTDKNNVTLNPLRFVKPQAGTVPVFTGDGRADRVSYAKLLALGGLTGLDTRTKIPQDADWGNLCGIFMVNGDNGFSAQNSGYPAGAYNYGTLFSIRSPEADYAWAGIQIYLPNDTNMYFRNYYNGGWRAWNKITGTAV